ncbi:hypothetical protein BYT27DRAFT_7339374 [Phlegmacium glaucopus]|nr:hypothetical protein BYT27DRAFT_7339374 [Phlegmacium glaucopus]
MSSNGVNPPGGVTFAIAILALLSAVGSILGFITFYIPYNQYVDLLEQMDDIHMAFITCDWPSAASDEKRVRLWKQYNTIAMSMELFQHLATSSYYMSVLHVPTAWKLRKLRGKARSLRIELIALYEIKRSKEIRKNLEKLLSTTSIPKDASTAIEVVIHGYTQQNKTFSRPWYSWGVPPEVIQATKVNDIDRLPV